MSELYVELPPPGAPSLQGYPINNSNPMLSWSTAPAGFDCSPYELFKYAAEIVNGVYGADTVTANYVQFWFRRFRSGISDVKRAPRTGRPVVEKVDKITEIIDVDLYVSSRSIAQELKIDHETVLNHLHKAGFKKKVDVWVPHQLTPKKQDGSNFHL
ncbi:histone-lysine N-methyltransferase SETMAR [Trichonephila clavipes]|nr:histone-lysine N-methyltransferase SETMAR [Trichonephila clavipes]